MKLSSSWLVGVDPSINGTGIFMQHGQNSDDFYILIFCQTQKDFKFYSELKNSRIFPIKSINKDLYLINRIVITAKIIIKFIRQMSNNSKCIVGIEDYAYGARGRMVSIGEFIGILKYELMVDGHQIKPYAPKLIKKFAYGEGNASKEKMKESFVKTDIGKKFPVEITKLKSFSDITDAYYIFDFLKFELSSKDNEIIPKEYEKIFKGPFYKKIDYLDYISTNM